MRGRSSGKAQDAQSKNTNPPRRAGRRPGLRRGRLIHGFFTLARLRAAVPCGRNPAPNNPPRRTRPSVSPSSTSRSVDHAPAFTLVEIMVVAVIIGLLAAIAIPAISHLQRVAQNNRFISDLRTFSQAFETYALEHGAWPPNAGSGAVPTGMSGEFRDAVWKADTSLGGRWNWDNKYVGSITAGISAVGVAVGDAQMAEIDAKIDDGNLTTGNFVKVSGRYTYILQK